VLEAAWFKPQSVRATSKTLGLRSEASMRFERGADLTAATVAMARAGELLEQTGAGRITGTFVDVYPEPSAPPSVHLVQSRIAGLLGMDVADADVERILTGLGFDAIRGDDGWMVTPPGWRIDQHRDVDLIEEIGRHFGFEHLPSTFPGVQQAPAPSDPRIVRDQRARRIALARGFSEAISFAFIDARHAMPFLAGAAPVALANPLSETFAVMRPSLLPGLLAAVSHNRRHGRRDVQLFEVGTRFSPSGESRAIALAWTGLATADHWSGHRRDVDFFDLKGDLQRVVAPLALTTRALADEHPALHPGRSAEILINGRVAGVIGELHPRLVQSLELSSAPIVAECMLEAVSSLPMPAPYEPSRFPPVSRDLALVVGESTPAGAVLERLNRLKNQLKQGSWITNVKCFDEYRGKGLSEKEKSLAFRFILQSPAETLQDADVDQLMAEIVNVMQTDFAARLRS